MTILAFLAAAGFTAAKADVLFYGGDFDNVNGIISQRDPFADARVYEDFSLTEPSVITGIFGTFADLHQGLPTSAYFEIRSGIRPGDGGTLLGSGEFAVDSTYQGGGIGLNFWRFSGSIETVELAAGDYWVAMALVSTGMGKSFIATTSGTNGVGEPLQNGNSFFDGIFHYTNFVNYDFVRTEDFYGQVLSRRRAYDFSLGVEGRPVPEPPPFLVLFTGIALLMHRLWRR